MLETRQNEALAAVLGICTIFLGLCSFATILLLTQRPLRLGASRASTASVPRQELSGPQAQEPRSTEQYRGHHSLSETSLRMRTPHLATSDREQAHDASEPRGQAGSHIPQPCSEPPAQSCALSSTPSPARTAAEPVARALSSSLCLDSLTGSVDSARGSTTPAPDKAAAIDIALLSRLDQALSSGAVRPEDADRLLKSYGCDMDELFREELNQGVVADGLAAPSLVPRIRSSTLPAGRSVTRTRTAARALAPPQRYGGMRSAPDGATPAGASPAVAPPAAALPPPTAGAVPGSSPATPATPPGPPLDESLLLRIEGALCSGAVRPEQAEQLLRSYGCDLEALTREDLA